MVTSVNIPPSWVAGRALQWCTWAIFSQANSPPYWGYKPQDTTFFPSKDPTAFSPLTQKKCCTHTHTHKKKKAPVCCMTVAWPKKKSAGSFFECAYFQDTLTTRKTIQVQHRDSQVHLLLLTGLVEHDEAILSQCFITTSVLWFQSTVPTPKNSTCHPGSWLGIARLHKPPNM